MPLPRPLGKALNAMDGVRGQVFERSYAAIEIIDDDALVDAMAYTVTNPAAADLVERPEDWPGLCLWAGGEELGVFEGFRKRVYDQAVRRAGGDRGAVAAEDFTEVARVEIVPPHLQGDIRSVVRSAVRERCARLEAARGKKRVLGAERVLRPFAVSQPHLPLAHIENAT